jgi:Na+-translocating ferredoxin:NAD+ oxidoreductase RNF subunit RnfB
MAERIFKKEAEVDACPVGGATSAEKIAKILGVKLETRAKRLAIIHCGADCAIRTRRADYDGVKTCLGANLVAKGENACVYSCLGYGDCAEVCPVDAIAMIDGLPRVDSEKCIACGLCVKACPKKIISLEGFDKQKGIVVIACSSLDKGAVVRKICKVGCIACRICEKNSPDKVFKVEDNLAKIYYNNASEKTDWEVCVEKCPTNTIIKIK